MLGATSDFDFGLPESATRIRDATARFAQDQIVPRAGRLPRRLVLAAWRDGCFALGGLTSSTTWVGSC